MSAIASTSEDTLTVLAILLVAAVWLTAFVIACYSREDSDG
jgi:hypothetical protein